MSGPTILTTHTGSLIRPPELLELAPTVGGEGGDADAYEQALESAVGDVVRRQVEAGIDVIDDGEMGKSNWITYLYERVSGIEPRLVEVDVSELLPPSRDRLAFPEFYAEHDAAYVREVANRARTDGAKVEAKRWFCTGPISLRRRGARARHRALPPRARSRRASRTRSCRSSRRRASTGCTTSTTRARRTSSSRSPTRCTRSTRGSSTPGFLLQVDDAVLMHEYDSMLASGGSVADYRRWAELRVDALNHALAGIPQERVRYHVCFGSWHGPHAFDPPLADVIDLVLRVHARYYLIEQANPRHEHEWRLWEDVEASRRARCSSPASSRITRTSSSIPSSSPSGSCGWRASSGPSA